MKFLKPGIVLFIVGLLAAAALGFTNEFTKDKIEAQRKEKRDNAMSDIIPEAVSFEDDGTGKFYWAIGQDGEKIGGIVFAYPNGFGGPVETIVGIGFDQTVRGVRMGSHTETPDLGSRGGEPEFYEQFTGVSTEAPIVVIKVGTPKDNEILAISGATVTSKGMTAGVTEAIEIFKTKGGSNENN